MDLTTIIGIIFGFGMLILGFLLEKGTIGSLVMLSPAIIVFGGTFGAVLVSYSMKEVKNIPRILLSLNKSICAKTGNTIELLELFADKARRDGLLSLEQTMSEPEMQKKTSPFFKKAMQLCLDGTEAKAIREILEIDLYVTEQQKKIEVGMFEAAGGFSPTMGIIGTVMGLVQVLSNMGSPDELAKSIAVAFIATLYGVAFANVLYLPVASKLKLKLKNYQMECELIIEGVISIQHGESPQVLTEKLLPFLQFDPKGDKRKLKNKSDGDSDGNKSRGKK